MLPSILRNKHFIGGELIYISISEVEFKKMKGLVYHWYITVTSQRNRKEEERRRENEKEGKKGNFSSKYSFRRPVRSREIFYRFIRCSITYRQWLARLHCLV